MACVGRESVHVECVSGARPLAGIGSWGSQRPSLAGLAGDAAATGAAVRLNATVRVACGPLARDGAPMSSARTAHAT